MASEKKANRLIHEKSPYLLQHAYNPVDWYAWGDEAFARARRENKPVFLSIGYSTCHWCHVMEEESFSTERIAKILNGSFVPIKVDREERPDIDHLYMDAVMAMTGSGGWPLNVFLTPEGKPFYGGTYFPPDDRYGQPGFETVLLNLAYQWSGEKQKIAEAGESVVEFLRGQAQAKASVRKDLNAGLLDKAVNHIARSFDPVHGGFGKAPKFPTGHLLSFLLQYSVRTGDGKPLEMVLQTLDAMRGGGIHDHLGGGFHRYSTDERWHVPHFEKMLYDQALLARAYLEAYQLSGKSAYAETARRIFDYVRANLCHADGGFFSAEDADSAPDPRDPEKKKEGAFYVWRKEEIDALLSAEESRLFKLVFGVQAGGNVRHDPFNEFSGLNVLYAASGLETACEAEGLDPALGARILESAKGKLYAARQTRLKPHLDDKILTDWNGLMIAAFACGARVLGDESLAVTAARAADFILRHLCVGGTLLHSWRDGRAEIEGFLDDYAFFIHGLFELYQATFDARYLEKARDLAQIMAAGFEDREKGGFYLSRPEKNRLFSNPKPLYDGAVPSGNSVAALSLSRLSRILLDRAFEEKARKTLEAFSGELEQSPFLYPVSLQAFDFLLGPVREIVIAGRSEDPRTLAFIRAAASAVSLRQVTVLHDVSKPGIGRVIPFVLSRTEIDGRPAAYVCENFACREPIQDPEMLRDGLRRHGAGGVSE